MQLNIYVKESDFETFKDHKPKEVKSVSAFMADILRKRAEFLRTTETSEGTPIIPEYPRR